MLFSTMPPPRGTWRAFVGAARGALRAAAVEAMRMVLMSFMIDTCMVSMLKKVNSARAEIG